MFRFGQGAFLLFCLSPALLGSLASDYPACAAGTLGAYQASFGASAESSGIGRQCSIGILLYSGFSSFSFGTGGIQLLEPSEIELTPSGQGFVISAAPGSAFVVAAGQTASYYIDYGFYIDPAPVAAGADLSLDVFGDVTVTQDFCIDSTFSPFGVCGNSNTDSLTVHNPVPLTNSTVFRTPAVNNVDIRTIIQLNGGRTGAGFDSIGSTVTLASTPEPDSRGLALCLGGVFAAMAWGRKKFRRTA